MIECELWKNIFNINTDFRRAGTITSSKSMYRKEVKKWKI